VAPGDRIETGSKPAENGGELSQSAILVLTGEPNGRPRPGAAAPTRTYAGVALPAGGCSGEAAAKLGQGQLFGGATTLADRIMTTSFAQAESDDRVVAVFGTWSDCMKQQGYAFKTPFDAAASANIETPAPSTVEIKTAVADVACKQKTNLVGVFYGVERGYQDSAIQQNIEQLNKLKAEIDQVVKAAAGALGVPVPK
jgi:hypothetical protein